MNTLSSLLKFIGNRLKPTDATVTAGDTGSIVANDTKVTKIAGLVVATIRISEIGTGATAPIRIAQMPADYAPLKTTYVSYCGVGNVQNMDYVYILSNGGVYAAAALANNASQLMINAVYPAKNAIVGGG